MHEIELKFQVPPTQREAVRRAVATTRAEQTRLQARYFDTPDRRLAQAGFALRLRQEGPRWVQTLKGRGDGLMQRLEHEVVLPATHQAPTLDLARHADTAAGTALMKLLGDAADTLAETFRTDIQRTHRVLRVADGARVELAFDEGEICAGMGAAQVRWPVCELEFELQRGPSAAVPALARRWVTRHGLWLDVRSKAERGERLARGLVQVPAITAAPPALHARMEGDAALRALVASALGQVLGNACELADGGPAPSPEHLHQCRVGLRRLRCALHDFGTLAATPALQQACAELPAALATLFRRLGSARDRDALRASLLPALAAAGAPPLDLPAANEEDPGAVLREPATQHLWLDLIGALHAPPAAPADRPTALREQLRQRLRHLHRQAQAAASATDDTGLHALRKRLKRLRYALEFCSPLWPAKTLRRHLAVLHPAQDALGLCNDLLMAQRCFAAQAAQDPHAWFALGWLAARRPRALARARRAVTRWAETPAGWRRKGDSARSSTR